MGISKELFLAILSMDAYNRGYDAGLNDGGQGDPDGLGVSTPQQDYFVGNARIIDSKGDAEAQDAGFYGIAYQMEAPVGDLAQDTIVISFRGTDNPIPFVEGSDANNGWFVGAGNYRASQAELAFQFYHSVKAANPDANIVLTGHSLGGGLAGHEGCAA